MRPAHPEGIKKVVSNRPPAQAYNDTTDMNETQDTDLSARFFARQPIFDIKHRTWGYAVTFGRLTDGPSVNIGDAQTENLNATAGMLSLADALFGQGRKIVISFGERAALDETPYALPADRTIIEVQGCASLPASAAMPLGEFREDGFGIALSLTEAAKAIDQIRCTADYLVADVAGRSMEDIRELLKRVPHEGVQLLARGVNGISELNLAKTLGFDLFQGTFFQSPEPLVSRAPNSHEASRFKLLGAIEQPDPDFDKLTEAITHDVAISYRLLSYLNSPAFGFSDRITSIRQAMVLLGWKQLKNWLRVVILTDISPNAQMRQILIQSVQRGKFFELAAASQPNKQDDPDAVFLLGLFSLLEPLLHLPMKELVEHLPLADDMSSALTGSAENRYSLWLRVAQTYECAEWEALDTLIEQLGLHPLTVSVAYYKSIMWAETFFSIT